MLISTKGRYALQILIDMAEHQNGQYIPLRDAAERQDISEKYLESIIKILVSNNIVTGLRGKGGGYMLTRSPDKITVGEVLRLTEGDLTPVRCKGDNDEPCARVADCRTYPIWQGLNQVINDYLDNYTLRDLMRMGDSSAAEAGNSETASIQRPQVT